MSILSTPEWLELHRYNGKNFNDLTTIEILDLKTRLKKFITTDPEVSVMIPAWNEENNIYRTLSSLASTTTLMKTELVVINNNSTDKTQEVLDQLGVKSIVQPIQGTPFARQLGLEHAKGKFHLCADSDTFYPPDWIDLMIKPMKESNDLVGVYGRYSFIPLPRSSRLFLTIYERITGLLIRIRRINREHINVLGFNMGFITKIGLNNGGFKVDEVRKFDNAMGSDYFVDEAEDGRMALNLKKSGNLKLITDPKARVFTSSRRLAAEGGLTKAFMNRLFLHSKRIKEYLSGKSLDNQ
jgi:glycosyltransferase involved in cell wall biosynthesis